MALPSLLDELTRHDEWADATLWRAVVDGGEPVYDDPAYGDKVRGWLHHIHLVQHAFLGVWRGEPFQLVELSEFADAAALREWGREGHAAIAAHLGSVDESELRRELELPWREHFEAERDTKLEPVNVEQSIVQVAMHSAHHRGQVAARSSEAGREAPLIDFIAWVWDGREDARWD